MSDLVVARNCSGPTDWIFRYIKTTLFTHSAGGFRGYNLKVTKHQVLKSPAHTMRFSSFVGRRDDEKIAWCERIKDDRLSLILPTQQVFDRFENQIGPTVVAWCERVKDIRRINRPITFS